MATKQTDIPAPPKLPKTPMESMGVDVGDKVSTTKKEEVVVKRATKRAEKEILESDPVPAGDVAGKLEEVASQQYKELVSETAEMLTTLHERGLDVYYTLGERVNLLMDDDTKNRYGGRTLDAFAADLNKLGQFNLGTSSLYKTAKVAAKITRAELDMAIQAKLSWRHLVFMTGDRIPHTVFLQTLERVKAGEIPANKAIEDVSKRIRLPKGRSRKPKTPTALFNKVNGIGKSLLPQITFVREFATTFADLSDEDKKKYNGPMEETRKCFEKLVKEATEALELLKVPEAE